MPQKNKYKICVIISGGQTGADRGGLDFAISKNIKHSGWCPLGRIAEDKLIPHRYLLFETKSPMYPPRTRMNIRDSDATLIFSSDVNSKGTLLTTRFCIQLTKPYYTVLLTSYNLDELSGKKLTKVCNDLIKWLQKVKPQILNIAGTRESHCPGIAQKVKEILNLVLEKSEKEKEWPPKKPTTPNLKID